MEKPHGRKNEIITGVPFENKSRVLNISFINFRVLNMVYTDHFSVWMNFIQILLHALSHTKKYFIRWDIPPFHVVNRIYILIVINVLVSIITLSHGKRNWWSRGVTDEGQASGEVRSWSAEKKSLFSSCPCCLAWFILCLCKSVDVFPVTTMRG